MLRARFGMREEHIHPPHAMVSQQKASQSTLDPSMSLPRRFRTRTPRHTPLIPPPLPQPFLRPQFQLPIQFRTRLLPMYEIAKTPSYAPLTAVEPTTRFSEIRHGGEFAVDGPCGVPARVECVAGFLGRVFVFESRVDVAD